MAPTRWSNRAGHYGFFAVLYLLGALHWCMFLNLGNPHLLDVGDWILEHRYYTVLQEAVQQDRVPWHTSATIHETDRFFGNPEIPLSPQLVLLRWMPIAVYLLVDLLLLYSAGFLGCLLLARRYRLSAPAFAPLFILFNFNGHIVSHLSIGHTPWFGYFLLPFFLYEVLRLLDGDAPVRAHLTLPLILFVIFLQGFFHLYNWAVLFLLLLALADRRHARTLLLAVAISIPLVVFRILPATLAFGHRHYTDASGYPSLLVLLQALTISRPPHYPVAGGFFGGFSWWEYDLYVGVMGLLFLVGFGILPLFRRDARLEPLRYRALDLPMLAMSILALNYFYMVLLIARIPLASAERAPVRFILLPFIFLLTLAVLRADRLYRAMHPTRVVRILVWLGILGLAFPLWEHSQLWLPSGLVPPEVSPFVANAPVPHLGQRSDPLFMTVCLASLAVSAISLVALLTATARRLARSEDT